MQRQEKKSIFANYGQHKKDTGSPKVQIAIFTERIKNLTEHLKIHKGDNHSRRGLISLVSKRRKTLNYLKLAQHKLYEGLINKLGIRK